MGRPAPGVEEVVPANGGHLNINVHIRPQALGLMRDVVVLEFEGFAIARKVSAACEPNLGPGMPNIAPTAPYVPKPKPKIDRARNDQAVPGEKPKRITTMWENPPAQFSPEPWLEQALENGNMQRVEALLSSPIVDAESYGYKLQLLLWIEEMQHEVDIRQYDMTQAALTPRSGGLVGLQVPGLAENRPSVMKGDALYVTPPGGGKEWQGYVHRVERDEVQLKFHPTFMRTQLFTASRYDVRFSIKRSTFVFMQNAIARAKRPDVLHPCTLLGKAGELMAPATANAAPLSPLSFIREQLSGLSFLSRPRLSLLGTNEEPVWSPMLNPLNEEQKAAVRAILRAEYAPMPYLVFGPPGTGKTNTTAEAAIQVLKLDPSTRILVTAPSNWAADLLATRMIGKWAPCAQYMMRINAYSRSHDDVDPLLLRPRDCCNYDEEVGAFTLPPKATIMKKRVIVVTCLMAAKLYALGIPQGHFTHIFLDEAGHAEEPLSLAAISGLLAADDRARFIMAGDPCQLGPVVLSKLAKKHGLDVSGMERLIHAEPYVCNEFTHHYDGRYITKLRKNYRSHPKILELPNKLFYENELEACADYDSTHSLLGFEGLPNRRFPIIFHAIVGKDEREANSPSWFNVMEVKLVVKYVTEILDMKSNRLQPKDIGIISPFRKQVEKLRVMLKRISDQIKVGSTEEFQGQERRCIIVTTVRSSDEHLEFDRRHRLGFLSNPKRFNVAMTRAKALLILIGNPAVLAHDPNWADMLAFIAAHGGNTGSALPAHVEEAAENIRANGTYSAPTSRVGNLQSMGSGSARRSRAAANTAGAAAFGARAHACAAAAEEASLAAAMSQLQMVLGGSEGSSAAPRADGAAVGAADDEHPFTSGLQVEGGEMPRWE
ncbi:P-loop containing nucleoside triphosphate hydrolase protein [Dunaliella salina]|uniref:RNA helicase n=1 Tax=Dunaliella salina TaxID=3046 RepID=A0ABQ7G999_DUNSA|nr:P-loop containing nucleoside triphosphate hydrolase protein [Dunaliella salina]|eukprot:KAF5831162.1 P-loop containing nucleoside triphosphate hydrolase protein [Dunaliella salina]